MVLSGFAEHPPLVAEFLSLVIERFPRLTINEGDRLIMNALDNDLQEMTSQQLLIIATLRDCSTSWGRDHLIAFLLRKMVSTP